MTLKKPKTQLSRGLVKAPPTTKDWRLKADAIGNLGKLPRHHKSPYGTTAYGGFSRCLPQKQPKP